MLRILTFGGLSVAHPDRELAGAVLQPRRLALLAVMARSGERGVTRERLLSLFWPDEEEERGRRALTQAIYALRRDLGDDNAITGNQELRLDADHIISDVNEFAQQLKRGRLAEAASLYAGPFLQGFHLVGVPAFERWTDDERTALAHEYARARERLANAAERANQMNEAVEHWRVLASVDPLNASVAVRYMTALEATGDRAGALKHARIYEALISQELELPPDRAVVELAARLRATPSVSNTSKVDAPSLDVVNVVTARPVAAPVDEVVVATAVHDNSEMKFVAPQPEIPAAVDVAPTYTANTPSKRRSLWSRPLQLVATSVIVIALAAGVISQQGAAVNINELRVVETKRVTFEEPLELDPAIAPNGQMVAYAGGSEGSMKLYVRQLDGGNPVMISGEVPGDHRRPRWSKNGTHILFQADRAIWMVPSLGGSPRVIVEAPADSTRAALYPAFSPDGKSVAWIEDGAILTREIDAVATRTIARIKDGHSLSWSPDGKFLAVAADNEGFVYGTSGALKFAGVRVGNIAPGVIYVVNTQSGDTTRIGDADFLSTSPDWLGDSRTLVFVSNQDGSRDLYAVRIDANGAADATPVRLTTGLDAHTVSVASDGQTIAYTTFRQSANLYSVALGTGASISVAQARALTSGQQTIEAMDVSPDGKWIAFDSDRGGQQDIFRVQTDGRGETERVISSPTDDFHPAWSPDGRSLAFYRIRDGVRRGAVVAATGGPVRFIGPDGGGLEEHSPAWSPDGKQLLFHRFNKAQPDLYAIEKTGDSTWSEPRRLTDKGGIWPAFSPSGRDVAYFSGSGEISVMSRSGDVATRRVVVESGANGRTAMYMRWAPYANGLLVRARDAKGMQAVWEVSPNGQSWRSLVQFDDPRRPSLRPEFATDGRHIYFTLAERSADVFTARLAAPK